LADLVEMLSITEEKWNFTNFKNVFTKTHCGFYQRCSFEAEKWSLKPGYILGAWHIILSLKTPTYGNVKQGKRAQMGYTE